MLGDSQLHDLPCFAPRARHAHGRRRDDVTGLRPAPHVGAWCEHRYAARRPRTTGPPAACSAARSRSRRRCAPSLAETSAAQTGSARCPAQSCRTRTCEMRSVRRLLHDPHRQLQENGAREAGRAEELLPEHIGRRRARSARHHRHPPPGSSTATRRSPSSTSNATANGASSSSG